MALTLWTYPPYPLVLLIVYVASLLRRERRCLVSQRERRVRAMVPQDLPTASILIPACNKEGRLPARITNLRELDHS